jgi:hypothetical protein
MEQQLDIFDDSRDLALRNDIAQALLCGDPQAAQCSADTLHNEFGSDPVLAPAALLIDHLRCQQAIAPGVAADVAEVLELRGRFDGSIAAAASAVLGPQDASAWLAAQWRWLAGRAGKIVWHPDHADAHAAALYLRGQAWRQAAEAVARIESWRRIPLPLLWMAQARWRSDGADAAWPLLAEALWLAPARAAALLPQLADARLDKATRRFEEFFEPDAEPEAAGWAWLPAWALVDQPLLAGPLATATPPPDSVPGDAFKLVMALLRLEREGRHREIVEHRSRLRSSSPIRISIAVRASHLSYLQNLVSASALHQSCS